MQLIPVLSLILPSSQLEPLTVPVAGTCYRVRQPRLPDGPGAGLRALIVFDMNSASCLLGYAISSDKP